MEDAIVTDVSEEEIERSTKYEDDFEALVARREQEVLSVAEPEAAPREETEKPMLELVDDDGNIIRIPASARYKAKIDGAEELVPVEKITRSYQVGAAADKRLEQATTALKDIEAKQRDLTEREKQFLEKQEALVQKRDEGEITDETYRATAKSLLEALTDENEEDPEGRIAEVLRDLSRPKIDPDKFAADIEKRTYAKIQERDAIQRQQSLESERKKANQRFETEYADVINDPIAYSAAKSLAVEKWQDRPNAAPWEIAAEVGNEIREWKSKLSPSPQTRNKPVTPRTVSARSTIGQDEKPETRADILAEMKEARGQPV